MSSASRALVLLIEERSQASRFSFHLLARSFSHDPAQLSRNQRTVRARGRTLLLTPAASALLFHHKFRSPRCIPRFPIARRSHTDTDSRPGTRRPTTDSSLAGRQHATGRSPRARFIRAAATTAATTATSCTDATADRCCHQASRPRQGNTLPFRRFGHPDTGEPVQQKPGAIFSSLLAGALLGELSALKVTRAAEVSADSCLEWVAVLRELSSRITSVHRKRRQPRRRNRR